MSSPKPVPTPPRPSDPNKVRDRAMVNLLLGIILLMPPVAGIFHSDLRVFDVPLTLVYLFFVWACLIANARWFASRLPSDHPGTGPDDE